MKRACLADHLCSTERGRGLRQTLVGHLTRPRLEMIGGRLKRLAVYDGGGSWISTAYGKVNGKFILTGVFRFYQSFSLVKVLCNEPKVIHEIITACIS